MSFWRLMREEFHNKRSWLIILTIFIKKLFGQEVEKAINSDQKEWLIRQFSVEVVEKAIKEMGTETAPSPDGIPLIF